MKELQELRQKIIDDFVKSEEFEKRIQEEITGTYYDKFCHDMAYEVAAILGKKIEEKMLNKVQNILLREMPEEVAKWVLDAIEEKDEIAWLFGSIFENPEDKTWDNRPKKALWGNN